LANAILYYYEGVQNKEKKEITSKAKTRNGEMMIGLCQKKKNNDNFFFKIFLV